MLIPTIKINETPAYQGHINNRKFNADPDQFLSKLSQHSKTEKQLNTSNKEIIKMPPPEVDLRNTNGLINVDNIVQSIKDSHITTFAFDIDQLLYNTKDAYDYIENHPHPLLNSLEKLIDHSYYFYDLSLASQLIKELEASNINVCICTASAGSYANKIINKIEDKLGKPSNSIPVLRATHDWPERHWDHYLNLQSDKTVKLIQQDINKHAYNTPIATQISPNEFLTYSDSKHQALETVFGKQQFGIIDDQIANSANFQVFYHAKDGLKTNKEITIYLKERLIAYATQNQSVKTQRVPTTTPYSETLVPFTPVQLTQTVTTAPNQNNAEHSLDQRTVQNILNLLND